VRVRVRVTVRGRVRVRVRVRGRVRVRVRVRVAVRDRVRVRKPPSRLRRSAAPSMASAAVGALPPPSRPG